MEPVEPRPVSFAVNKSPYLRIPFACGVCMRAPLFLSFSIFLSHTHLHTHAHTHTRTPAGLPNRKVMLEKMGMGDVPIWGLISEDVLTNEATLEEGYTDDGEEH